MRDASIFIRGAVAVTATLAVGGGIAVSQATASAPAHAQGATMQSCQVLAPSSASLRHRVRDSSSEGRRCFPLDIDKTGPSQATFGDTIPYTITVTNTGRRKVHFDRIVVTDPGVNDLTPPADPPDDLKPGDSATWTASRTVTADLCGTDVVNTAWVRLKHDDSDSRKSASSLSLGDSHQHGRSDSVTTTITCPTDLTIVKTGPASVAPGAPITYSIVVTNNGQVPVPTADIQVTDPNATPPVPVGPVPTLLQPGGTLTWTATGTQEVTACGAFAGNTATVSVLAGSGWTETNPDDNASTWNTQIVCPVSVSITKTSGQTTVAPGGTATYSIFVTNTGAFAIPEAGIAVDDPGATLGSPSSTGDLVPGATRSWIATKNVPLDPATCGTQVANTASVSLAGLPAGWTDAGTGTRVSSAAPIPVEGGICPVQNQGQPDPAAPVAFRPASGTLGIVKVGPKTSLAGGNATFRLTVINRGAADLSGVVVTDQPPASMALGTTPTGATRTGSRVTWNIGNLASGQSVTKSITVRILRTTRGTACNVATASAAGVGVARARACTTVQVGRRPATPVTG